MEARIYGRNDILQWNVSHLSFVFLLYSFSSRIAALSFTYFPFQLLYSYCHGSVSLTRHYKRGEPEFVRFVTSDCWFHIILTHYYLVFLYWPFISPYKGYNVLSWQVMGHLPSDICGVGLFGHTSTLCSYQSHDFTERNICHVGWTFKNTIGQYCSCSTNIGTVSEIMYGSPSSSS